MREKAEENLYNGTILFSHQKTSQFLRSFLLQPNAFLFLYFFLKPKCLISVKICVVGNPKVKTTHTTKYCDLLEKSKKTIVSCLYKTDRLGCLSAVSVREADFSLFDPEDLYYSTLSKENLILVASEIRDLQSAPFQYRYVVVIRKSSNITGIKDLAGKKLCHPGLESGPDWSHLFAQVSKLILLPMSFII